MQSGLAEALVRRVPMAGVRGHEGLAGLELKELVVGTAGLPVAVEISQESPVRVVQASGEPSLKHVPAQCGLELLGRRHRR